MAASAKTFTAHADKNRPPCELHAFPTSAIAHRVRCSRNAPCILPRLPGYRGGMAYNANDRSWYAVLLRFVLTLGLLNAVSCVASELHVCVTERGEVLCEPDAVCMPFGCVPQSAVVACANLGAEAMCQVGAVQGRCFAGACITVICGDGLQGATEACDDGNTTDGDGCSANCASNETCGNGVLDPGEACDDANLADDDGCHANCEIPRCGDGIIEAAFGGQ